MSNKTEEILNRIRKKFHVSDINITDLQISMLTAHINAMEQRNITLEKLPEIDINLFQGISHKSIDFAKELVAEFAFLQEEEIYLLAIHFENIYQENL